jgi:hypothetical protein
MFVRADPTFFQGTALESCAGQLPLPAPGA